MPAVWTGKNRRQQLLTKISANLSCQAQLAHNRRDTQQRAQANHQQKATTQHQ